MTFKELAEFILSQPEEIQESEASFVNLDEDEFCTINCDNVKAITVVEKDFAPAIFGVPVAYRAIATSDDEIDDKYDYHSW